MAPASEVQSASQFKRNARIEEAPLQGELMLFDPESSKFYVLNRTMAFVWRSCDGVHSLQSMIEGLQAEFEGAEAKAAEQDLRRALAELLDLGLVLDSSGPPPLR